MRVPSILILTFLFMFLFVIPGQSEPYWAKTYHGNSIRNAHSAIVKQTSDGGYIMAGDALFDGSSYSDIAVLKLDRNGDVLWQKVYSGTGTSSDEAADIIQTSEGGYILVGSVFDTFGGDAFWVLSLMKLAMHLGSKCLAGAM